MMRINEITVVACLFLSFFLNGAFIRNLDVPMHFNNHYEYAKILRRCVVVYRQHENMRKQYAKIRYQAPFLGGLPVIVEGEIFEDCPSSPVAASFLQEEMLDDRLVEDDFDELHEFLCASDDNDDGLGSLHTLWPDEDDNTIEVDTETLAMFQSKFSKENDKIEGEDDSGIFYIFERLAEFGY